MEDSNSCNCHVQDVLSCAICGSSECEVHLSAPAASESDCAAIYCAPHECSGSESMIERAESGSFHSAEIEIELSNSHSSTIASELISVEIIRSKSHWSTLADQSSTPIEGEVVAEMDNPEVFKTLQLDPTWGSFFKTFDNGEMVVGEKIGEGGQAEIYLVDWRINPADRAKRSIFEEQIELSKAHWTELAQPDEDAVEDDDENDSNEDEDEDDNDEDEKEDDNKDDNGEVAKVRNQQVFKELQENSTSGKSFFYEFEEGEMVRAEEKFAEGGQAELFHAHIKWRNSDSQKLFLRGKDLLKDGNEYVLKVFKQGTPLEQFIKTLPQEMLKFHAMRVNEWMTRRYICDVVCVTLLEDGRFAFVLQREQIDLRKLIDRQKKLQSGIREGGCGPFPKEVAENFMYEIALGMKWLHGKGIVHRDLKASNVLVRESGWNYCFIADYECSVGTIGTGFWRAPEILEAVQARKANQSPQLFTEAADVYAYGMTCYEILTGELPFQTHSYFEYDLVLIDKQEPKVPEHVDSWVNELLRRCWQFNPQDRPSFGEILNILRRKSVAIQCHEKRAHPKACEWTHPKTEMLPIETLKTIVSNKRKQQSQQPEEVEAQVNWRSQYDNEYEPRSQLQREWVLKVLKKGTFLRGLEVQLRAGLLELHADRSERAKCGPLHEWEKPRFICDVLCAMILNDGRLGFVLGREHQDLRRLIERTMVTKEEGLGAPFPMAVAERMMHDVACGVDWLHSYNIIHRDVKASNVFVTKDANGKYQCYVGDYECSIEILGTGFFRAPEILEACRAHNVRNLMEVFSKAADVYAYGMTCYEILTGKLPFENHPITHNTILIDLVINQGLRPELPEYVDGWARELLSRCWRSDPTARPSFWQIQKLFETPEKDRMERLGDILGGERFNGRHYGRHYGRSVSTVSQSRSQI